MTLHWQELTVVAVVAGVIGLAGFGGGGPDRRQPPGEAAMRRGRCLQLTCAAFARAGWVGSAALSRAAAEGPGGKEAPAAIQLFQFKPSPVEVKAGTRVTSGTPENRDGRFDGKLSGKGTTFAFAFTQPGTYSYFCARHQSMRGEIVVN